MIKLYHNDMSVCAQKVRLALAELGLEWESIHLKLRGDEQLRPDYLAINPKGQVPAIVDGDFVVVESTVINEYLADAYGHGALVPRDSRARARMRWWTRQLDDDVHESIGVMSQAISFRHQYLATGDDNIARILGAIPDEKRRELKRQAFTAGLDNPALPMSVRRIDKLLQDMDRTLADSDWLADETFSLADVGFIPYVVRVEHLGLDRDAREPAAPPVLAGAGPGAAELRRSHVEVVQRRLPDAERSEGAGVARADLLDARPRRSSLSVVEADLPKIGLCEWTAKPPWRSSLCSPPSAQWSCHRRMPRRSPSTSSASGRGERVVIIHGGVQGAMGGGPATFAKQKALAAEGFRVEIADRPGFGQSPTRGVDDMDDSAAWIAAALSDGAHLIGHSWGGGAALAGPPGVGPTPCAR